MPYIQERLKPRRSWSMDKKYTQEFYMDSMNYHFLKLKPSLADFS